MYNFLIRVLITKKTHMFKYKSYYFFILFLLQVNCSGITNNNGYMPVQEDIENLSVKKTTVQQAKSLLGEPALVIGKSKPVLVYFSQATRRLFFFEEQIMERNLLVLRFDKGKRLKWKLIHLYLGLAYLFYQFLLDIMLFGVLPHLYILH